MATPMTLEEFDRLTCRDFENGAVKDEIAATIKAYNRLQAIVAPLEELTKDSAASVLFYEVAGADASEKYTVAVNRVQPPLLEHYAGATFAEALAKAVEAKRIERQEERERRGSIPDFGGG